MSLVMKFTFLCIFFILDNNTSLDWTLRHGHGMALGVALKEGAETIWTDLYKAAIKSAISALVESDRVCHIQVNS